MFVTSRYLLFTLVILAAGGASSAGCGRGGKATGAEATQPNVKELCPASELVEALHATAFHAEQGRQEDAQRAMAKVQQGISGTSNAEAQALATRLALVVGKIDSDPEGVRSETEQVRAELAEWACLPEASHSEFHTRLPDLAAGDGMQASALASSALIAIRPFTITQEGRPIARLHPDGRSEGTEPDESGKPAFWAPGPTLHSDGTIILSKGGLHARLDAKGDIYILNPDPQSNEKQLFCHIEGLSLRFTDSKLPWTVRIDDRTIVFNGPGAANQIEGEIDPEVQHTALVMTAAFFIDMAIAPP